MLSSYSMNQTFMNTMNNNRFPPAYNPRDEYFLNKSTTTHINLPKNINVPNYPQQSVKGHLPSQQMAKPPQKVSSSRISFPSFDATKNIESLNVKRTDHYLNKQDEAESYDPKKKVKLEKQNSPSIFESFMSGFTKDETSPLDNLEGLSFTSFDLQNSTKWYDSHETDPLKEYFMDVDSIKEPSQLITEIKSAVALLKDDFNNKKEDLKDGNKFLSITFEFPVETPQKNDSDSDDSGNSPTGDTRNNAMIPHEKKKAYQVIKNGLDAISEADVQRLGPEIYLNDNLINFYLKLIENGFLNEERKKKCYFFNTYFMAQMGRLFTEVGKDLAYFDQIYEKLKKWTKKVNLFEKDFIFLPVNDNDHWNVIVLCHPSKMFSKDNEFPFVIFLDSLCRMDSIYSSMLFQFFSRELRAKMPEEFATLRIKSYKYNAACFPFFQHMVPKQSNGTDCGLYLLQFVEMFAEDETFIIQRKEDLFKMQWFPRKLADDKRDDMRKMIEDLQANKYETIDEYLQKRATTIRRYSKDKSQYDTFNPNGYEKAVNKTYAGRILSEQDKRCLALDYYFLGTLDYDELRKK